MNRSVQILMPLLILTVVLNVWSIGFAVEVELKSKLDIEKVKAIGKRDLDALSEQYKQGNMNERFYKAQRTLIEAQNMYHVKLAEKVNAGELTEVQFNERAESMMVRHNNFIQNEIKKINAIENSGKVAGNEGLDIAHAALVKVTGIWNQEIANISKVEATQNKAVAIVPVVSPTQSTDPAARLTKLKSLLEQGLITKSDYDKQRTVILNSL